MAVRVHKCTAHVCAAGMIAHPGTRTFALQCLELLLQRTGAPLDSIVDSQGNTPLAVAVE